MRVLILGSNSMAGHVIKEYLSNYSKFELSKIIYLSIIHEYSGLYQVGSKQKISKFDLKNDSG